MPFVRCRLPSIAGPATIIALAVLLPPRGARADLPFASVDGWTLSTNGRVNGFFSGASGDGYPGNQQGGNNVTAGSGIESFQTDANNNLLASRIRSGFLASVLGFSVNRPLSERTTARAHIESWAVIESSRAKAATNAPDVREAYVDLEGPWGGLLVGRSLALFSRGAILMDFLYQHGNGLGNACNTTDSIGPSCGHVGYGVIFAGFNSQITYRTPPLGGLQLTAGIFDPVSIPGKYERTPIPRVEAEAVFDRELAVRVRVHLFVNGLWQRLEQQGNPPAPLPPQLPKVNFARGVGYGGWLDTPIMKFGFAGYAGRGLGLVNTLENTPNVFDSNGAARLITGYYGFVGIDVGRVYVNGGIGVTRVQATTQDAIDAMVNRTSLIAQQRGISAGVQLRLSSFLVAVVEYFRADHDWYLGEKQGVNFVDTGLTMVW